MNRNDEPEHVDQPDIAIIGFAGRFPGAATVERFWRNLRDGIESISFFSDEQLIAAGIDPAALADPHYVKAAPMLDDIDQFDAQLFGYSPHEAKLIDPQQRVFLECAWEALEHAGYDAQKYPGLIGVYGGSALNTYLLFSGLLAQFGDEYLLTLIGNDKDYLTTRVSYKLNLTGPSVSVQTACSTSLVAVHLACQALLNDECDLALAGGVAIRVPQLAGYFYQAGSIFSPDGHCRSFDAQAKGVIFGSGAGIVVLKRLQDAQADGDTIHALIKGSAINNDGAAKIDFTAPSVLSQAEAMVEALASAGIDAAQLSYVEAHGTGTPLGDPIEIAALTKAFRTFTDATQFCAIGSVKPNIGHLDAAAGVAGLIKTVLALTHQTIPASLHFAAPNPEIDFERSPFYVNASRSAWPSVSGPRRAGVNSLGMGGTNAFVVVEEAPPARPTSPSRPHQLLLISAKTSAALEAATSRLADALAECAEPPLADVAYTLQVGRKDLEQRRMAVCADRDAAVAALRTLDPARVRTSERPPLPRDVVFMFSGQGAQYVDMGRDLYQREPVFTAQIDRCAALLRPHLGLDLREILYPPHAAEQATQQISQTWLTQPALFTVEYALAQLWLSWGVQPAALIGHSIGEYVAATLADVFTLPDALQLVAARGRLMQTCPPGAMISVPLAEQALLPLLGPGLDLAAVNGAALCAVAGPAEPIAALATELAERGVVCRPLHTSHAFHSAMMEPAMAPFAAQVARIAPGPPAIPLLSNVTGGWLSAEQATDPDYWASHLRHAVRFADGLHALLQEPQRVLLEVGPGQTLSSLARLHPARGADHVVLRSLPAPGADQPDDAFLLDTLGQLWLSGFTIDWSGFYADERRQRRPLPTYPFQRQRYWVEDGAAPLYRGMRPARTRQAPPAAAPGARPATPAPIAAPRSSAPPVVGGARRQGRTLIQELVANIWQDVLDVPQISLDDDFFELGGNSILVMQAITQLNETFDLDLSALNLLESPTVASLSERIESLYQPPQDAAS